MQNLSYSIGTERANYADMNDNVTYVNRYEQSKGNSQLKTAITHSLSYLLMYKSLFLTLNYDYVYRPLLPVIYSLEGNSAVTVSSQDNLSHRQALSAMLNWRNTYKCYTASLTGSFRSQLCIIRVLMEQHFMMDIRRQFLILIMISSFLSIFCSLCLGNKSGVDTWSR